MSTSVHVCARCTDNFIVNSKLVTCKLCENSYHLQCVQIKDQVLKVIKDCDNLFWYCDDCVSCVNEKLDIVKSIKLLEQQTKQCVKNSTDILKSLDNENIVSPAKNDWSSVVKKKNNNLPPLLIKPKKASQDSAITKQVVTQKINPSDLSISVKKLKSVGQGTVVIECNDSESLKKLQTSAVAKLSEDYNVELPKTSNPKIVIVGLHEKYLDSEDNFVARLKRQSNLLNGEENNVEIIRKYIPRNKKLLNVVLEVSPAFFRDIIKSGKIFIDWESFPVYEYVGVLRCYKCWRYGHKAANCHQKNIVCPLCNKNHRSSDCSASVHECTNCKYASEVLKIPGVDFKHTVFDKNCISYKKAQENVKSRTQYI